MHRCRMILGHREMQNGVPLANIEFYDVIKNRKIDANNRSLFY